MNIRTKIARALWLYDRENDIYPCQGNEFLPIAIPKYALSMEINTLHYGKVADKVIDAIKGSYIDKRG